MTRPLLSVTIATLFIMSLSAPVLAQAFKASNRTIVNPVPGGFEAIETDSGARGMWCGAAEYARSIGAAGTDRVYVATARGDSLSVAGRKGVVFTLDATGLTPLGVLSVGASVSAPGSNLSVDHAGSFCADYKLRNSR
jgi:hypothetical protein